jgi:hypothetical protein
MLFYSTENKNVIYEPYSFYAFLVVNRFYKLDFVHSLVPGELIEYDLPDLAACLAPVKLIMAGITDVKVTGWIVRQQ